MADSLTEGFQRDWNLTNSDTNDYNNNNNHVWQQRQLTRKVSDNNNSNNQQPQLINDYNNVPASPAVRTRIPLSVRKSLEAAYDTDGAVGTSGNISKHHHHHHHHSSNNYEHLISPRLPVRRPAGQLSRQTSSTPLQHQLTHKLHLSATPSISSNSHNHDDRDEDSNYESDSRRRHIRLSRRVQQPPVNTGNHGTRTNHLSILPQHGGPFVPSPSVQPLRIIFMRHGERANQALGPDWFNRAFRTNTYRPYDENLPRILPKRRFDQAYEFDAPLTGKKSSILLKFRNFYDIF